MGTGIVQPCAPKILSIVCRWISWIEKGLSFLSNNPEPNYSVFLFHGQCSISAFFWVSLANSLAMTTNKHLRASSPHTSETPGQLQSTEPMEGLLLSDSSFLLGTEPRNKLYRRTWKIPGCISTQNANCKFIANSQKVTEWQLKNLGDHLMKLRKHN